MNLQQFDRNQEATVWVGNLEPLATEELVWELMVQAGPVVSVNMPRDKVTNTHQGYAFCEFRSPTDAEYAIRIMNNVKLFGKPIRVNRAARNEKEEQLVPANLFVGNLDPDVDEKMLFDTFSAFGNVVSAKIMFDPDSGQPRGFAFVNYDSFEAADAAITHLNGQFLMNRNMHVSYAYKKDGSKGERYGTPAERLLAANRQAKSMRTMDDAAFSAATQRAATLGIIPPAAPPAAAAAPAAPSMFGGGPPPMPPVAPGMYGGYAPPPVPPAAMMGMPMPPPIPAHMMPPGPPMPMGMGMPMPGFPMMPPGPPMPMFGMPPGPPPAPYGMPMMPPGLPSRPPMPPQ